MPFREGADGRESTALHARRLHVLFDHLPALIGYWDRDGRNVLANAAYMEWFGRTPQEMHGLHISEVLGPEVYAKNLPYITGALNGDEQLFERTLVDASGRIRHTQASYVPDLIDGQNYGFFVLVTDVTPRVEAQRALDDAQRLAQVGSWSMNLAGGDITWSDELYRIFGLSREEFSPTLEGFLQRVDPRDIDNVRSQLEDAGDRGDEYDLTYRVRRADGSLREVHSRGRHYRAPDGTVVRLAGTLQDVTASNAAVRELSRVNGELRKVNQLNADVLAMLGHDVRAPVSVILGYLEELSQNWDQATDAQRRAHLDRAFGAASRLRDLVDNILSMASVESGRIVAAPAEIDVLEHVREALVATGSESEVGAGGEEVRACADPFHLRQIVSNLVVNAQRHGAPPIDVHVSRGDGGTVSVVVRDHGAGVPGDRIASLFDRFVGQGSSDRSAVAGTSTGFGLYIAAGLAAANDGTLTYDGDSGGARFCLSLPLAARLEDTPWSSASAQGRLGE